MPNFWALPPEINSTRIYLGPGSGPILAAAQGWNALASELEKTKVGLQSALDTLLESYRGQSSQALIQQTLPYVQWLTTTAEHAHKTAIQLTAAANAYEQARAATRCIRRRCGYSTSLGCGNALRLCPTARSARPHCIRMVAR